MFDGHDYAMELAIFIKYFHKTQKYKIFIDFMI